MTTRRGFLVSLGTTLAAVSRPVHAQQPSKTARIGFFNLTSRQSVLDTGRYNAFVQGMRELGYTEGSNLVIEARFADGSVERLPALAGELVRLKVDVIVVGGTSALRALHHATTTIPIVVTVTNDPVGDGFAASLARPGGNITGLSITAGDLGAKHLDLLKTAVPKLSRVALLLHPENPGHPLQLRRVMSAAQKIGIQLVLAEAGAASDIEQAFATMRKLRADAAIILGDSMFLQEMRLIATQALAHRMPSISVQPEFAEMGGLMSYGASLVDNYRRAAAYVDKILKGAQPGDLPFEQPTRYELVINRKTSLALRLTIPQSLLLQASQVIQ